jgi:lipid-A-disaccharide synthase
MEAAGCELWYPHTELALRGYAEVITHLPALLRIRGDVFRRLRAANAPLFVGVDAPDFNLGLEAKLKRRRIRTMHYVSPSVWAWRRERIGTIAARPHSRCSIRAAALPCGIRVTFVGHPLAAGAATTTSRRARELLKFEMGTPVFALLPGGGCRAGDAHRTLLVAAALFKRSRPGSSCRWSAMMREYFERVHYRLQLGPCHEAAVRPP